jgi:hypothetical protein
MIIWFCSGIPKFSYGELYNHMKNQFTLPRKLLFGADSVFYPAKLILDKEV